jgi:hypothetical protein
LPSNKDRHFSAAWAFAASAAKALTAAPKPTQATARKRNEVLMLATMRTGSSASTLSLGPGPFPCAQPHQHPSMLHPARRPLATLVAAISLFLFFRSVMPAAPAVPDKLIVLTFDDSSASHYAVARPVLKRYGFGATFFITEGFTFPTNKKDYLDESRNTPRCRSW